MVGIIISGTVVGTRDPEKLGRVQVKMVAYEKPFEVWLRILWPYGSSKAGFVFLPETGDEVAILKSAGDDIDGMVILGALYNNKNKPLFSNPDGKNNTKLVQTRSGNRIEFSDKDSEESILFETKTGQSVFMQDKSSVLGLHVKNSDGTISLKMDKNGVKLDVNNRKNVVVNVTGNATMSVQGDAKIDAKKNVTIKAGMNAKVEAGTVLQCKAGVSAKVEAPQVSVTGSAMVTVKGGLVKLN